MEFRSFFDLVSYAHAERMCTTPGCTTCGCMPFRTLCKDEIGFDTMCGLINAVSQESIIEHDPDEWYEPLRIVYDMVFPSLPTDSPLMTEYLQIRERLFTQMRIRKEATAARVSAEKAQAMKRKEDRARRAEEHRTRSKENREKYWKLQNAKQPEDFNRQN